MIKTNGCWILSGVFVGLAVLLGQFNHLTLSIIFGAIAVFILLIALFALRSESRVQTVYPVSKLTIVDFAGVTGEVIINFGALTLFYGTSKLNQTVGELLKIFSDREKFEQIRQPCSGVSSWKCGSIPLTEETKLSMTVSTKEPRYFAATGKLKLLLSDGKEAIVCASSEDVAVFIGDAPLPVFSPLLCVVTIGKNFEAVALSGDPEKDLDDILGISRYFSITAKEVRDCIQGVASDQSIFDYSYKINNESELLIKVKHNSTFLPVRNLSSGELKRFVLDMAIRVATYSAKTQPTVLAIDQSRISSLDDEGWSNFLKWIEKSRPAYQVVIDFSRRPSGGDGLQAFCYDAVGTDMAVTSFDKKSWDNFKKQPAKSRLDQSKE